MEMLNETSYPANSGLGDLGFFGFGKKGRKILRAPAKPVIAPVDYNPAATNNYSTPRGHSTRDAILSTGLQVASMFANRGGGGAAAPVDMASGGPSAGVGVNVSADSGGVGIGGKLGLSNTTLMIIGVGAALFLLGGRRR